MSARARRALVVFPCPRCGHQLETASSPVTGRRLRPRDGEVGVCVKCAAPVELHAETAGRWLTAQEVAALPPGDLAALLVAIVSVLTSRPVEPS